MAELQRTWIFFMLGLGLLGVIFAWLALLARPWHTVRDDREVLEYPEDHKQARFPVPPLLLLLYIMTGLGMVSYVIWTMLVHPGL